MLPLFVVSGASGAGKSSVCHELLGSVKEAVLLDSDILWRDELNRSDKHRDFFETWLRMCKNISQSGMPVVLFGAGMRVPENMEQRVERRYFSRLHYLALVYDDDILAKRLHQRPKWRRSADEPWVTEQISFHHWFKENGDKIEQRITLLDTTDVSVYRVASRVLSWIRGKAAAP